jgi:twitching motility protein PilT
LAVANTIREEQYHRIPSMIATGSSQGMQTMEASLKSLVAAKKISQAQADEILAEEA